MLRKKKNLSNRIPSSLKNALLTVAADYNGLFLIKKNAILKIMIG